MAKVANRRRGRAQGRKGKRVKPLTPAEQAGLTEPQYRFSLTYCTNGFNGAAAGRIAYPNQTAASQATQAYENLRKPLVKAFIAAQLGDVWKAQQMGGEEALALVAGDARADVRMLYDAEGALLNPHDWPDEIAASIESVDLTKGTVKLASKGAARRTILEQTGKLGDVGKGLDELAKAMREDVARHTTGKAAR